MKFFEISVLVSMEDEEGANIVADYISGVLSQSIGDTYGFQVFPARDVTEHIDVQIEE